MSQHDILKTQLSQPLRGIPGSSTSPAKVQKADAYLPDRQSPDIKASNEWDEATRKRWSPLSELPGFIATRGDLEFLNACGMHTGMVKGIPAIQAVDMGRAKSLLSAR